ncbi:hypothetical protein EW146_g4202 [Bondarzewia mesenterica]|uniref:Uncharacterized protein n=1 Tax=Bondarzewia mesenterica TaxID=1095465 RepID=A0A4S4M136_9AGAM|nr:hypothetical protein EW146_g4202 [Bondarzewia mesenterica]
MSSSAESSKLSPLVDVTYKQLHQLVSGYEGATEESTEEILKPRLECFKDIRNPFGCPNEASRKKVASGTVTLRDGSTMSVPSDLKEAALAISKKFDIDEVEAAVLLRSFIYNLGLPEFNPGGSLVEDIVEAFTPFYYAERRCLFRILASLLRANESDTLYFNEPSTRLLPKIIPDASASVLTVISECRQRIDASLPEDISDDPRLASAWVKECVKDQLVFLELLFWLMWSYVPREGELVIQIYETGYDTNLGSSQQNGNLLLDEEGARLQQDCAAFWILVMISVLELEAIAVDGTVEISETPSDKHVFYSSANSLKRIHEMVVSHGESHFAPIYASWTLVLWRLETTVTHLEDCPPSYRPFFESLDPHPSRSYSKTREPVYKVMLQQCLAPEVDPNSVAYRSVMKGLVTGLLDIYPVEFIPGFDTVVEVWIALFGRGEVDSVAILCQQYWQSDYAIRISRRAILDVARTRFPIQIRPLVRLLQSLTGSGFVSTDPLASVDAGLSGDFGQSGGTYAAVRTICAQYVSVFLDSIPTYTQMIPSIACVGAHAVYEKVPERYGSTLASAGPTYLNLRPLKLPGGSILPIKSTGNLLSQDGEEFIIVAWQHEYSGWKLLKEVLVDYVRRRRLIPTVRSIPTYALQVSHRSSSHQPVTITLEDIGVVIDPDDDMITVSDIFDLFRSVIHDDANLASQILESVNGDGDDAPKMVQIVMLILEDALSRSNAHPAKSSQMALIASALGLISSFMVLPNIADDIWLFARSSTALFGTNRNVASASAVLAAERTLGSYTITKELLYFVRSLFTDASSSVLLAPPGARRAQLKEEVLMRALRFVHTEIWVEHVGWKYAQLGNRFEVGRMMSSLYSDILDQIPPTSPDGPLLSLSQAVFEALVSKATTSSINPLTSAITTSEAVLRHISASSRLGDSRGFYLVLKSHLRLIRLCLTYKQRLYADAGPCLLEQALCSRSGGGGFNSTRSRADSLDVLAGFVADPDPASHVALEASRVLYSLCSSLSSSPSSAPTILAHLSDPEATVASFVRVIRDPYRSLEVRLAVWRFMALAVEKEPALGNLFVTGRFQISDLRSKSTTQSDPIEEKRKGKQVSALQAAREGLGTWRELLDVNPAILSGILGFLTAVWQRGLEHQTVLKPIRESPEFWKQIAGIIQEDMPPAPEYKSSDFATEGDAQQSSLHDGVFIHSHRVFAKSHAIRIVALDIAMETQTQGAAEFQAKPQSYRSIEGIFKDEDSLVNHLAEATSNTYDPTLYDDFEDKVKTHFPNLSLSQLESRSLMEEREFGEDFAFTSDVLLARTNPIRKNYEEGIARLADNLLHDLYSINMNLSLAHMEIELGESWQFLLQKVAPHLKANTTLRPTILSLSATISETIAIEKRRGELMSKVHGGRLSLLLSLLELAWFSTSDSEKEVQYLIQLVKHVHDIVVSEPQSPVKSVRGYVTTPFHRTLLQIIYFCAKQCRNLAGLPKALNADRRLVIASMIEVTMTFVIDSLRFVFDTARSRSDPDLDLDMQLLVVVFEQCTRTDINPSTTHWLTLCQETDVIRASLDLFVRTDLTGLSSLPLTRARKQPLYAPHILSFHVALASLQTPAERLATEGVLVAYSNNSISSTISSGSMDVTLPELPGERNPAHQAYCVMLSVVTGVITALGMQKHFFDAEASGFVQLYGNQISRALSWTINDPLSLAFIEEMERVINLFYSIASTSPSSANRKPSTANILSAFSSNALLLLQQLNYALTHPNQLASLLEPVTAEERAQLEKDSRDTSVRFAEVVDPIKKPFLARLVHRLFGLTGNIICTLIAISESDAVLRGDTEDLPSRIALVVPHSKVVLGEPASMGTLLELANCTLDILNQLGSRPAGQTLTPPSARPSDRPLDVGEVTRTLHRNLEVVLFYATTQLGAWLAKPELFEGGGAAVGAGDAEMEDLADGRMRREPAGLAERLRRGMTGEMASELKALMEKAKGTLEKSAKESGAMAGVDVIKVLIAFLNEKVVART